MTPKRAATRAYCAPTPSRTRISVPATSKKTTTATLPTVPRPRDIEAAARHPPVSPPDPARPARVPFNREAGEEPAVRGTLHAPADAAEEGLVLTHGAGASSDSPLLVALADVLAGRGFVVLRCDLPFRQARPHGPPSPAGAARDRTGLRAAVEAIRGIGPQRVDLGGHSYGGRQASLLAAEDPSVARALLLLSYPLHPPRTPGRAPGHALPATPHTRALRPGHRGPVRLGGGVSQRPHRDPGADGPPPGARRRSRSGRRATFARVARGPRHAHRGPLARVQWVNVRRDRQSSTDRDGAAVRPSPTCYSVSAMPAESGSPRGRKVADAVTTGASTRLRATTAPDRGAGG